MQVPWAQWTGRERLHPRDQVRGREQDNRQFASRSHRGRVVPRRSDPAGCGGLTSCASSSLHPPSFLGETRRNAGGRGRRPRSPSSLENHSTHAGRAGGVLCRRHDRGRSGAGRGRVVPRRTVGGRGSVCSRCCAWPGGDRARRDALRVGPATRCCDAWSPGSS